MLHSAKGAQSGAPRLGEGLAHGRQCERVSACGCMHYGCHLLPAAGSACLSLLGSSRLVVTSICHLPYKILPEQCPAPWLRCVFRSRASGGGEELLPSFFFSQPRLAAVETSLVSFVQLCVHSCCMRGGGWGPGLAKHFSTSLPKCSLDLTFFPVATRLLPTQMRNGIE